MNEGTKALVEAITYLKQDSSHFKDYVFPFVTGLFSSLLGAGVAYWIIKHQDECTSSKPFGQIAAWFKGHISSSGLS